MNLRKILNITAIPFFLVWFAVDFGKEMIHEFKEFMLERQIRVTDGEWLNPDYLKKSSLGFKKYNEVIK